MDDSDFLLDLLTYTCAVTGRKRVAGAPAGDDQESNKTPKLLA